MFGSWLPSVLQLLDMGAGRPLVPPAGLTVGPGWYAADDGLVPNWSAAHRLFEGEARRYFLDFEPMGEIQAGDALTGTPTLSMPTHGPAFGEPEVNGTRVQFTVSDGAHTGLFPVKITVSTEAGSVFVRRAPLQVELFDELTENLVESAMALQAATGWYASNDGLVTNFANPHRKDPDETRRYWMDFSAVSEIIAGDVILQSPPPTVAASPSGPTFANIAVVENRVEVDIAAGTALVEYLIVFTITTDNGAIIKRGGRLRCASL